MLYALKQNNINVEISLNSPHPIDNSDRVLDYFRFTCIYYIIPIY